MKRPKTLCRCALFLTVLWSGERSFSCSPVLITIQLIFPSDPMATPGKMQLQ